MNETIMLRKKKSPRQKDRGKAKFTVGYRLADFFRNFFQHGQNRQVSILYLSYYES